MTDTPSRYAYGPGALSSAQHAAVDPAEFYADILPLIPARGVFIDVGGGAGRDAIWLLERADEGSAAFNIEPDPARHADAVAAYPGRTALTETAEACRDAIGAHLVATVPDSIQSLANFNRVAPGVRGDFVLCGAVLMFIPAEDHALSVRNLFNLTAEGGVTILRYRTENLKPGMVAIDHTVLEGQCRDAGFAVTRTAPRPDPLGRDHVWHQLILRR